jgi:hypothetical protein
VPSTFSVSHTGLHLVIVHDFRVRRSDLDRTLASAWNSNYPSKAQFYNQNIPIEMTQNAKSGACELQMPLFYHHC